MSNKLDTDSNDSSHNLDTNSVTLNVANTHCIVCGSAFEPARKGKLYCSPRCKQFGYYHKFEISQVISAREMAINPKPISFFIEDYIEYNKKQKLVRRYANLKRKNL